MLIQFDDIYNDGGGIVPGSVGWLYQLLEERTPDQAISHNCMPTPKEHVEFVASRPYLHWYLIRHMNQVVGCIYLSKQREIGVTIFERYTRKGLGAEATKMIMERHPGPFLANVNPRNILSQRLFERLGFRKLQVTYRKEA